MLLTHPRNMRCSLLLGVDEAADIMLVSGARLDLGEEVCIIGRTGGPDDVKNVATDAVAYPVVAHVVRLGLAELYGVVGDTHSGHIVSEDCGRLLRIVDSSKTEALEIAVLAVGVERSILRL